MSSGRYSGKALKDLAKTRGARVTRTQTAAQAVRAIEKKYKDEGGIKDTVTYYHRGNGEWTRYSPSRDAKKKPRKGVRRSAKAKKKFGSYTKNVKNARGKTVGKVRGSNSHKADTKRTKKTYKGGNGRKYRGSV